MLFSPIQLYGSNWPDALQDTTAPGFGRHFGKERMGTDPAALAAQVNYLRQILNHVNPYTGVALKDEPAILFIELVNEPWHHPEDMEGSIRYINALTDAVRSTGCSKLDLLQREPGLPDRRGDPAVEGAGRDVRLVSHRAQLRPRAAGQLPPRASTPSPTCCGRSCARLPRIVYEFDSPDLRTGTMYPAMARTFRAVGDAVRRSCSPTTCCGPPRATSAGRRTT